MVGRRPYPPAMIWWGGVMDAALPGEMVGTPAITVLDGYGGGRVVLNSPHPELTPRLPQIYAGELRWVTRRAMMIGGSAASSFTDASGG